MHSYEHDKNTLRKLMKISGIKRFKVSEGDFGGRKRLLLRFWKTSS